MISESGGHLTPVDLDALELGLDDGGATSALERHCQTCLTCRQSRAEHRASAQRFAAEVFERTHAQVAARVEDERRRRSRTGRLRLAIPLLAAAAAAVVLIVAGRRGREPSGSAPSVALAMKGVGAMHVFARRAGKVFPVHDGATLVAGDAIRFFIDSSEFSHVLVASVDGAGKANIYYPYGGARSARLAPGRRLDVPGSILLDRAPGPERLFAIFSREPLSGDAVRAALESLAAGGEAAIRQARELPLPGTGQATLMFEKGAPR